MPLLYSKTGRCRSNPRCYTFTSPKDYTLAAIGGANGWPIDLYALENNTAPFTATGKIRITHLSPFSATLNGTGVDICTQTGAPVTGLTGVPYRASTGYLSLPAGVYDLKVALAGSNCAAVALDVPPFSLAVGQVADVFAIGLPGSAQLPLQLSQTGLRARVSVGHMAPFANAVISTSVTVRVAGSDLITGFVFGRLTPYIDLPVGAYPIEIIPTGAVSPAITGTAVISGFLDFTVVAIGNGTAKPLKLMRLIDDNATLPNPAQSRVRVTHLAPLPPIIGTKVDLCTSLNATPLLDDFDYKQVEFLALPAGLYSNVFLSAPTPNCAASLLVVPEFAIKGGDIAYVYAVGDVSNLPPGILARPDITPQRVRLPIIQKQ
jgi:hypothetical protein